MPAFRFLALPHPPVFQLPLPLLSLQALGPSLRASPVPSLRVSPPVPAALQPPSDEACPENGSTLKSPAGSGTAREVGVAQPVGRRSTALTSCRSETAVSAGRAGEGGAPRPLSDPRCQWLLDLGTGRSAWLVTRVELPRNTQGVCT